MATLAKEVDEDPDEYHRIYYRNNSRFGVIINPKDEDRVVAYVLSDEGGFCSFNPLGPVPKYTEEELDMGDDLNEDSTMFYISR